MVGKKSTKVMEYIAMALVTLIVILPMIWLVFISFKDNADIMTDPLSMPKTLSLDNYASALQTLDIGLLYKNTFIIALLTLVIEIPITFCSSFALARLEFKRESVRNILYPFMLIGLAISPFILLFPIYRINHFFGMGERLSLVMPYISTSISFNTLLFVNYLHSVPKEIDEAAIIDGTSLPQLIAQVMAPIALPVLSTVIIFNLLYIWNEFPFASIMVNKATNYTLSRGIAFFKGKYSINYAGIAAYSVMIILPELVVYTLFQKNVMDGMTAGAVKG